ncbi:FAD/NAD(P)-binding protein [Pseudogemmobacter bohemicus]|uniref:FAD/NAD(P)-binding protein n=1 Tax=Pseudogemmobacter bohemicus TaxID=2250708 RepID=UPI000DD39E4A|nr:FAD/NAD(P)-binding protein [Pseudogemmobacter bohemicus]
MDGAAHKTPGTAVIVIGDGLSGALAAAALLNRGYGVTLIGVNGRPGQGTAYADGADIHQANGPASALSADPTDPDHFSNWLEARYGRGGIPGAGADIPAADAFVPRWLYGRYAAEILQAAARGGGLTCLGAEVTDLEAGQSGVRVTLADGRQVAGSHAVLATGLHFTRPGRDPAAGAAFAPWDIARMRALPVLADVAIIGSGLSMVDAVSSLAEAGHQGRITVFSRHGRRPEPRRLAPEWPDYLTGLPDRITIRALFALVVRQCRLAIVSGGDWQSPLDLVRAHIGRWWWASDDVERRRFLRHVRSLWEVHHHRAPPLGHARVAAAASRLTHIAATVQRVEADPGQTGPGHADSRQAVTIHHRPRGGEAVLALGFDAVILSAGVEYDWRRIDRPLVRALLRRGLVRPGPLALGIDATREGRVIDRDGEAALRLFALGPLLRGLWWESTAIPDIARQSFEIAEIINPEPALVSDPGAGPWKEKVNEPD